MPRIGNPKREAGIIARQTDCVISSDDTTFSSSASEMDDDGEHHQHHHHHSSGKPVGGGGGNMNAVKKMKTGTTSPAGSGSGSIPRRHNLLTAGNVCATTDDLGNNQSSSYFEDNFPTIKHAISKLSTAASLGSDSDSMRNDDFDDEDIANSDDDDNKKLAAANSNDVNPARPARFEIGDLGIAIGGQSGDSNLVDAMTNMRVNALERRLILSPDVLGSANDPFPSLAKRTSLTLTPKQKCMSVSNVATMEQQMAFGFPIEVEANDDFLGSTRLTQPRRSAVDIFWQSSDDFSIRSVSCQPTASLLRTDSNPSDNANNVSGQASPVGSLSNSGHSPVAKMASRPERKKAYTTTQLMVPKILLS